MKNLSNNLTSLSNTNYFEDINPKQSFPEMDEKIINFWKENNTFQKSIEMRPKDKPYRFYDGPPFITGMPHYGHLLASTIKDIIPRYQTMQGKRVERVWGWDCHGIAVEEKVMKKLGITSNREIEEKIGVEKFIEECYKYTAEISSEWEWYVDHIGRGVDMKNAYKTMDKNYMESVMWTFKQMYDKGLVYKGKRISQYSVKLGTPISNFEVSMDDSYLDVQDDSVTVRMGVKDDGKFKDAHFLVWTTTPWTLPSNMAIGVNKDNDYVLVVSNGEKYILAKNRLESTFKGKGDYETLEEFKGSELVGLSYKPVFNFFEGKVDLNKDFKVYHADFITDKDGTGVGHQAPEFGEVDFQLGKDNSLFQTESIDDECKYNDQVSDYKGVYVKDANPLIIDRLKDEGKLFKKENITHRVAVCPRTQVPLIYRTQDAWFLNINKLKPQLLKENQNINWFPEHLKDGRFAKNIETAPDWCLSRKRYWATPVPMWICKDCGEIHVFGSVEEIEKEGKTKIDDLHKPFLDKIKIDCKKCGGEAERIKEVLDVWMESGSMSLSQFHYPFENKENFEKAYPADFIVEYIGQIRAWFYVMHVIGVALFGKNSYKNVITTGVIAGNDGRKMSKSFGNFTDPKILLNKYGGDATRFYMASSPVVKGEDMDFKDEGVEEVIKKVILPVWNTLSFFTTYANIDKFKPTNNGNVFFVNGNDNKEFKEKFTDYLNKFSLNGKKIDTIYINNDLYNDDLVELLTSKLGNNIDFIKVNNCDLSMYKKIEKSNKNTIILSNNSDFKSINKYLNNLDANDNDFGELDVGSLYKLPNYHKNNKLDRWIISKLNEFNLEVKDSLDNYRLNDGTKAISNFIEDLTNWYIRRSRKRFWGKGMEQDKLEAYNTLYDVLLETSKIIAPYLPFLSEEIYKNLTKDESVHLDLYPEPNKSFIFKKLNDDMALTQSVVKLGLSARSSAKIRVRQPLSDIKISSKLDNYYENIIKEELNIKEITVFEESELPKKICKPNARVIGPKFGKDVKFIISEAKIGNFEELSDGKVKVGDFVLEPGEFEIEFSGKDDLGNNDEAIEFGNGIVISLNKTITEELKQEGYIRDLIRNIQEARKEMNLKIDSRVKIELNSSNSELKDSILKFVEFIETETLSKVTYVENLDEADNNIKDITIEDIPLKLRIKRD